MQEGKHSHTYTDTVCELTYPVAMPHIVLLPRTIFNNDLGMFSGIVSLQKVELEGDFGKYFNLYAEASAQVQVREIFTPDIMQDLMEQFKDNDLEIIGTKVYLLEHGQFTSRAEYQALHALGATLIDKFLPGLRAIARDETTAQ